MSDTSGYFEGLHLLCESGWALFNFLWGTQVAGLAGHVCFDPEVIGMSDRQELEARLDSLQALPLDRFRFADER